MMDILSMELIHLNSSRPSESTVLLISSPIKAVLDSTDPFLELPESVCFMLAEELNLDYVQETGLFLMDEPTQADLRSARPTLQLTLASVNDHREQTQFTVKLPFDALDHSLSYVDHMQPYFPIRIADSRNSAVLGRTIFQEMYVSNALCVHG